MRHDPHQPLTEQIRACTICAQRFAATATHHQPHPVVWYRPGARILIAGQAPGMRVHETGVPFNDRSGERLREWMGMNNAEFYDRDRVAIVPMAFCFPGYDVRGADLPPPAVCARTWHGQVMAELSDLRLVLLVGAHAQRWHLGVKTSLTETVARWRDHAPRVFPLPHPSWRNTAWLNKNPWFARDLLPVLQTRVREVLDD
ncbi:uracil-DNA glycosylase family protein [Pontibaca salina]|uniref:Uracil-DNA glycosylase family protein n=1 Tax=Pontibaca salina TaxID=2795731 RepID=A0A934LY95_9RHOB|nr:uracil-DNA glycosylase family protein [Pontibaca salina]MBI6629517.1 uracil-DNA glycosylase family protein [Pontibaca salina]